MKRYRFKGTTFYRLRTPEAEIDEMKYLVNCSFVTGKSVSYLDLSLREFSDFKKKFKCPPYIKFPRNRKTYLSENISADSKVFFTEESCKKCLAPNRKMLYDLHLDMCMELEHSLRNGGRNGYDYSYSENVILNKIVCKPDMYETCLINLIREELKVNNQKIKLINLLSRTAKRFKFLANSRCLIDVGLACLYKQHADSITVNDFLATMNMKHEYLFDFSVDIFKFYLYHANQTGYSLWPNLSYQGPINVAIDHEMFVKAESLFLYLNAPRFCDDSKPIWRCPRWVLSEETLNNLVKNKLLTRARYFLILQIVSVYLNQQGLKALQMVWRSISDPFITYLEFTLSLPGMPAPRFTELTSSFVPKVTGVDLLERKGLQTRKLQHHCRTVIRRVLSNNRQLATGVDQLELPNQIKLPTSLKSYLKLEM